ncbi:hypothetical protein QBC38DRAFT_526643 [Podospora fimiseda]|uniref:DUF7708 domain-containing protein n=1 Tax=Podospora fimiseda TaxID=252190 RepID=A0AAN6YJM9_9PEZI|nr:hypothetical protein QBC38DRAFT_526643 [Podospora fimiseda]
MALTPLYPNQHGVVDLLIQEGNEVKDCVATVTETFISTVKKKYKTGINPDEQHTIRQLESLVSEAIQKHQDGESKGAWGKVNLACRKLSEGKDNIEGWPGLLPSENNYLSIVSGGLKLILKAAARITKVRDRVLEALQQIPTILNSAQRVLNIYHDSAKLKELSKAFYISTLSVLGHILNYIRRKASRNLMKVVFQPGSFQEELFQKLEQLTKDRNAFNEEADLCQKEMLDNLGKVIQQDNHEAKEERARMEYLLRLAAFEQGRANRVIGEMLEAIKRRQSEIGKAVDGIKTAVTEPSNILPMLLKLLQGGDGVQGFAISMHNSNTPTSTQTKKKKPSPPKPSASQIRKSILSSLCYSPTTSKTDLFTLLSLGPLLPRLDQDRSLHLINSPLLHSWISNPNCASLLINSNYFPISKTRSAISFVTARLSYALEQLHQKENRKDIIPLYFFSGLHYSGDEEWENPAGVVNSLLAQVLSKCRDVNLTSVYDVTEEIDCHDISEMMDLLERAIKEIFRDGNKTIFVIVAGLSFWLDSIEEETRKDAEELVSRLMKLGEKKKSKKGKGVVKVLLSAAGRFHFNDGIQSEVGENVMVLDLPVKLPPTGGFTNMKWEVGVGRCMEALDEGG